MQPETCCQVNAETLSFQHLDIDVTIARAGVFREAICDLLLQELGVNLTTLVRNPEAEREGERERAREGQREGEGKQREKELSKEGRKKETKKER